MPFITGEKVLKVRSPHPAKQGKIMKMAARLFAGWSYFFTMNFQYFLKLRIGREKL